MLKLENISKYYYASNSVVPALRKINLEFALGEFVVITGESGSGKSTILNIISGLDTYDEGEMWIKEEATSHFDDDDWEEYRKNKISYVFQNYKLIENYSAIYNIESVLLIQGYELQEARKRAKELLGKVGLKGLENHRTSKLSAGQKQRLAIARALAKNTQIIIADEPTGNLDSETGKQIMKLLVSLSKERLIIVVTHNYEEAEPYATRKIRIHDGEIVADLPIHNKETQISQSNELPGDEKYLSEKKSDRRIAWRFTLMNAVSQKRMSILFLSFLFVAAMISFVFISEIFSNLDNTFTKDYDTKAFLNGNSKRIVVKKPDNSDITEMDMKNFNEIKYVEMSDLYDYANDINYYITSGEDYDYSYQYGSGFAQQNVNKKVNFLQSTKFVRSAACITKEDLREGQVPKERNEVVLYSEDASMLGKELPCYFTAQNMWQYDSYYSTIVKVVGLLKKKSDQIYFSSELCSMLTVDMYDISFEMQLCKNNLTGVYEIQLPFIPVIGEGIEKGILRISSDLVNSSTYDLVGEGTATVTVPDDNQKDETQFEYNINVINDFNESSKRFVEINEDWFYELCDFKSSQASLYLTDYVHTDEVLKQLKKKGYEAISVVRLGSIKYNSWKAAARSSAIGIALLVLMILGMVEVILSAAFLKVRHKDYRVLPSVGMNYKTLRLMYYYEMLIYAVEAILITIIAMNIFNLFRLSFLTDRLKYYHGFAYAVFVLYNILTIFIALLIFGRYLKRKYKLK